jgi:septum formation protein
MTLRLVLASTSPTRRAVLDAAGLVYEARSPNIDETPPLGLSPGEVARSLALQKARAVALPGEDAAILGADQVLDLDGASFGKPPSPGAAAEMLRRLSGREHFLRTGVALLLPARNHEESFVVSTRLRVRELSEAEITGYVETGEWRGCAGGYRVEGQGGCLFEEIDGDYFNVLGLPLPRVISGLRALGLGLFGAARG